MSWSRTYTSAKNLYENTPQPTYGDEVTPEQDEQMIVARQAAMVILGSTALGEGGVVIYLNGHANKDHLPAPGWSSDSITVTVTRTK